MAKLIYVGPNPDNKGGFSSKAYTVRRTKWRVVARYGSVQSIGGGGGKLHWVGVPRTITRAWRSKGEAMQDLQRIVSRRLDHGYEKLPGVVRIYSAIKEIPAR